MYDLCSKFNTFYRNHVVLPQEGQEELRRKKDLNIQRLKDGLEEYNEEYSTSYAVVETCVQGSMAMSTIVQNENNNYDIDVAIVFNKSCLGDKGAQATRNMVANALRRKTKQFNVEPEIKTSCVRVKYADGYHIDFAVYRRSYNESNDEWIYEHAGSDWTVRDLSGLTEWFKEENDNSDGKLRKVVRLSKMFCKSREYWKNMPGGLLQTVLCQEKLQDSYDRIDELFYYTMKQVVDRLELNTSVIAPVDNGRDLTPRQSDIAHMTNWTNRISFSRTIVPRMMLYKHGMVSSIMITGINRFQKRQTNIVKLFRNLLFVHSTIQSNSLKNCIMLIYVIAAVFHVL